jgi:hypothetical protein
MTRLIKNKVSSLFIAALFLVLFGAGSALSASIDIGTGGEICLSSGETSVDLRLDISDNGFVTGDFCIDGCGCGTILGEAHIADVDGIGYGTIDFYADLAEVCAYGLWYSVDMPSLSHIWYYTGLDSTRYNGTGDFEEISCVTP